jgi:hypothetical protein
VLSRRLPLCSSIITSLSPISLDIYSISTQSALTTPAPIHLTTTYSNPNVTEARVCIPSMQCNARNLKRSPCNTDSTREPVSQNDQPQWTIPPPASPGSICDICVFSFLFVSSLSLFFPPLYLSETKNWTLRSTRFNIYWLPAPPMDIRYP